MSERVLVTGGLGFIGSAFVRRLAARAVDVLNVDAYTYAGDERRIAGAGPGNVETRRLDVADLPFAQLVEEESPRAIVHFAAESHVTRSERDADLFYRTNVAGTERVLEAAEAAGTKLVVHVSTDEVYGPCSGRPFKEEDKLPGEGAATSAYARSKAVADDLARSYVGRVPVVVARPTNCFGPWQHPEKAIARWTTRALRGLRIPVWGRGDQVRDWMFVEDAAAGIETLLERGVPGETYNLGPQGEQTGNLEIARLVARAARRPVSDVYLTEYDRPDHDLRYAVDASKMRRLGWEPVTDLATGILRTVEWYREHEDWWRGHVREAESLYEDAAERRAVS